MEYVVEKTVNRKSHSCKKFARSSARPKNCFCSGVLRFFSSPFTARIAAVIIAWSCTSISACAMVCDCCPLVSVLLSLGGSVGSRYASDGLRSGSNGEAKVGLTSGMMVMGS